MTNETVADGVVGPCPVCGTRFWSVDEEKLSATIIRHRLTNKPPCGRSWSDAT